MYSYSRGEVSERRTTSTRGGKTAPPVRDERGGRNKRERDKDSVTTAERHFKVSVCLFESNVFSNSNFFLVKISTKKNKN